MIAHGRAVSRGGEARPCLVARDGGAHGASYAIALPELLSERDEWIGFYPLAGGDVPSSSG